MGEIIFQSPLFYLFWLPISDPNLKLSVFIRRRTTSTVGASLRKVKLWVASQVHKLAIHFDSFHKIFKQSINDQFVQNLSGKLSTSNRLRLLNALTSDRSRYTRMCYIDLIKSCDIRNIFTRLRIDCHVLE